MGEGVAPRMHLGGREGHDWRGACGADERGAPHRQGQLRLPLRTVRRQAMRVRTGALHVLTSPWWLPHGFLTARLQL